MSSEQEQDAGLNGAQLPFNIAVVGVVLIGPI